MEGLILIRRIFLPVNMVEAWYQTHIDKEISLLCKMKPLLAKIFSTTKETNLESLTTTTFHNLTITQTIHDLY